ARDLLERVRVGLERRDLRVEPRVRRLEVRELRAPLRKLKALLPNLQEAAVAHDEEAEKEARKEERDEDVRGRLDVPALGARGRRAAARVRALAARDELTLARGGDARGAPRDAFDADEARRALAADDALEPHVAFSLSFRGNARSRSASGLLGREAGIHGGLGE